MVSESAFLPKSSKYKIYIIIPLPTISINQPPKYPYLGKLLSLPGGCFSPFNVGRMTPTSSYLLRAASQGGILASRGPLDSTDFLESPTLLKRTPVI